MSVKLSKLPDHNILELCKQGDAAAFEVIFNRYWKRLYTYAFKVLDNQDTSDDVVQEVFINFWNKLQEQKNIESAEAYLFTALKNQIANALRKQKFNTVQEDALLEVTASHFSPLEFKETQEAIEGVINTLPEKCRNVFYLSRFEEMDNQEIATKLNISKRTVETHISNALKVLKEQKATLEVLPFVTVMLAKLFL